MILEWSNWCYCVTRVFYFEVKITLMTSLQRCMKTGHDLISDRRYFHIYLQISYEAFS